MDATLRALPHPYEHLVSRVLAGDESAFDELYRSCSGYVARIVFRILGQDDADVDDIVQQAFIDASAKLHTLKSPGAFRVWVGRIAVNHCSNQLSKRKRARAAEASLHLVAHDETNPERAESAELLWDALSRIEPPLRIPWILHRIEGETIERVADLCDVSGSTAKRRVRDCEDQLRSLLDA